MKFTVDFYNLGVKKIGFRNVNEALAEIKKQCFEGNVIDSDNNIIATYSPLSGITYYEKIEKDAFAN